MPGWAAGWNAAQGAAGMEPDVAVFFAAAAAFAGALLFRRGLDGWAGAAVWIPILLCCRTETRLIGAAFAAGAVSALPQPLAGSAGKRVFSVAFGSCVLAAMSPGGEYLSDMTASMVFIGMTLPCATVFLWRSLHASRLPVRMIAVTSALPLLLLVFRFGSVGDRPPVCERIRSRAAAPFGWTCFTSAVSGEELSIREVDEELFYRHVPTALTSALQPGRSGLRMLFIGTMPSAIPLYWQKFPFVRDVHCRIGRGARAFVLSGGRNGYDLIFVSEYPKVSELAKERKLLELHRVSLSAGGVMIVPSGGPEPPCRYRMPLPGSYGRYTAAADEPGLLCGDLAALDRRLEELTPSGQEFLPPGILPVLYGHCLASEPPEPSQENTTVRCAGGRLGLLKREWVLPVIAICYLAVRLVCGRYLRLPRLLFLAENGMSWIWLVAGVAEALSAYCLTDGFDGNAIAALAAAALPATAGAGTRSRKTLCSAAAVCAIWLILSTDPPGVVWMAAWLLFAAARVYDFAAEGDPAGGARSSETAFAAGCLAAAVLLPIMPAGMLLAASLLILLPGILRL